MRGILLPNMHGIHSPFRNTGIRGNDMKPISSLAELKTRARELPSRRVAVVRADEEETLSAVAEAVGDNMVEATLLGPERDIRDISERIGFDLGGVEIIDAPDDKTAAYMGVDLVRGGRAHAIMKGLVASSSFLHAILDKETGMRGPGYLSHVAVFEVPSYHKLLIVTDAAMNIAPDFDQKVQQVKNAVIVAHALGISRPKTTYVCAKEVPYDKMPCTIEAARMNDLAKTGEFGDIIFDAPLAMDLAVSSVAKKIKKIESEVAGDADLLLLPDIEAANVLYKTLIFLAGGELGAVIMGAQHPVVLTSRADSAESKLCSIVLSGVIASYLAEYGAE
jgi:phosphate butyryltransferase